MNLYKYLILFSVIVLTGYFSIELKPLEQIKKGNKKFDAASYARDFLESKIPSAFDKAIPLSDLINSLNLEKIQAFTKFSHSNSIGNSYHFLVQGEAIVTKINEDDIEVKANDQTIRISTEFIYNNSIRDASGIFDIKLFTNTADINAISAEINKIIRTELIPPFKQRVKIGDTIHFIGALELNQSRDISKQLNSINILPIKLEIAD